MNKGIDCTGGFDDSLIGRIIANARADYMWNAALTSGFSFPAYPEGVSAPGDKRDLTDWSIRGAFADRGVTILEVLYSSAPAIASQYFNNALAAPATSIPVSQLSSLIDNAMMQPPRTNFSGQHSIPFMYPYNVCSNSDLINPTGTITQVTGNGDSISALLSNWQEMTPGTIDVTRWKGYVYGNQILMKDPASLEPTPLGIGYVPVPQWSFVNGSTGRVGGTSTGIMEFATAPMWMVTIYADGNSILPNFVRFLFGASIQWTDTSGHFHNANITFGASLSIASPSRSATFIVWDPTTSVAGVTSLTNPVASLLKSAPVDNSNYTYIYYNMEVLGGENARVDIVPITTRSPFLGQLRYGLTLPCRM